MPTGEAQVATAQRFLRALGFDGERCNERSALVALALMCLRPDDPWMKADAAMLRTVEIMEFLRDAYGKEYRPNTRETIRRRTLHQFVEAGFVVVNPDDSGRPVNSPNTCYQLQADALRLARRIDTPRFASMLKAYLDERPGLQARYARARKQRMVPVVLPDGVRVELTPGGQNVLIKQVVEGFCPRWTPAGRILYIGDAGKNDPVYDAEQLLRLGISLDKHGKLPDLVVYMQDRGWLVLMEVASTHGPIDAKRYGELYALFGMAKAGLVFVSCLPSRAALRRYLPEIAWETEVWCADNPSHLIHFNGERFLGPY